LQCNLALVDLFQSPTIAALADRLSRQPGSARGVSALPAFLPT
jgi:hypothetical protein